MDVFYCSVVVAFILDAFQSVLPLMKQRHLIEKLKVDEDPLVVDIHVDR